jgi:hypothetical protein
MAIELDFKDVLVVRTKQPIYYGPVLPLAVPVGCNVYVGNSKEAYVWLCITSLEDGPEPDHTEEFGAKPDWFDGTWTWEEMLLATASQSDFTNPASAYAAWLCRNGLAPGQSFLVRISPSVSRDYWTGETDVYWNSDVVARVPIEDLISAWESALTLQHLLTTE